MSTSTFTGQSNRTPANGFPQNTSASTATASRTSWIGFRRRLPGATGALILDNGQFHKANKLSVPSNVELIFLPPYSPELNPVERLWQDLKDQLAFDFHEHLSSLRQKARTVVSRYTDEAVASLTGYDYLLEATSVL
jgi:hypothetical protein